MGKTVLLALALLISAVPVVNASQAPGFLGQVNLAPVPGGRWAVMVAINGMGPFRCLVDTATSHTIISSSARQQLALVPLPRSTTSVVTAVGSVTSEFYRVELATAGAIVPEIDAVVVDLPQSIGISCILGTDFLANFTVDLNPTQGTLTLYRDGTQLHLPPAGWIRGRNASHGLIIVPGRVERADASIVFDTGAHVTIGNIALSAATGRVGRIVIRLSDYKVVDLSQTPGFADMETFAVVSAGGITWRNRPVLIAQLRVLEALGLTNTPTVFVGMDLLAGRRVVFQFSNGSVWLSPA